MPRVRRRRSCETRADGNEKGGRTAPFRYSALISGSVLPAIDATSLPTPVKLDQSLATHGEGGVQKRPLVELRKCLLEPRHGQTSPPLAQHLRDRSLNWRGLSPSRASRSAYPRRGRVRALSGSDWPTRKRANGLMEFALGTLDLFLSGCQCATDKSIVSV